MLTFFKRQNVKTKKNKESKKLPVGKQPVAWQTHGNTIDIAIIDFNHKARNDSLGD